jgi:hypothetical protein
VRLTVGLITLATVLAAVVAYGTHAGWAQYPHGLDVILFCRLAQWPALFLSVVATLSVVAMVAAGKRRAWWLIGLAPVLALFLHRFATDPTGGMASVEDPAFVPAARASFVNDDDFVVGLTFGGKAYAYPYAGLYSTPVVIHAQHDHRILVIWSPTANRALATTVKRSLRARDLDIVSTPANALLLYDTGRGQFINGLTGMTARGEKPPAFAAPIPTAKMPWRQWRAQHPDTAVMVPGGALAARAPRQPLLPSCPMPWKIGNQAAQRPVVVVGTSSPVALASGELRAAPVNVTADGAPVVTFRDPTSQLVRAFARKVDDLSPQFKPCRDPARVTKGAVLVDLDTNSGWNADGVAVDAKKEFRNRKLPPVVAEDGLYWGVMKYWYPQLELTAVDQASAPDAASANSPTTGPVAKAKSRQPRTDRLLRGSAKPANASTTRHPARVSNAR